MATQTEYVLSASPPDTSVITVGTTTRQWMTPQGVAVNEVISGGGGGGAARPVVQVLG